MATELVAVLFGLGFLAVFLGIALFLVALAGLSRELKAGTRFNLFPILLLLPSSYSDTGRVMYGRAARRLLIALLGAALMFIAHQVTT
jgi:hypothetical protein